MPVNQSQLSLDIVGDYLLELLTGRQKFGLPSEFLNNSRGNQAGSLAFSFGCFIANRSCGGLHDFKLKVKFLPAAYRR